MLRALREERGLSQKAVADALGVDKPTISKWECGKRGISPHHSKQIQEFFAKEDDMNRRSALRLMGIVGLNAVSDAWSNDLLSMYERGVLACLDLYYSGHTRQVEAILPLYLQQCAALAQQSGPLQIPAARLAAIAYIISCEVATDREDYSAAAMAGRRAILYAQAAGNHELQIAALLRLIDYHFHLCSSQPLLIDVHSKNAIQCFEQAESLFTATMSPLLKGRVYAGAAELYAMRGQLQESMRFMGLAYESYPRIPEEDPFYPYIRASRYSLYVFGDAQSRLFLHQPDEAARALEAMEKESNDPEREPITKVDLLYYQAEIQRQREEREAYVAALVEAAELARKINSRLYFNKLAASYYRAKQRWGKDPSLSAVEDVFQL
jgi:DNA-binding XRE family transcriptional regulator